MKMKFIYNDGGRKNAGFKGEARDCVCRSVAITTQRPYREIYKEINALGLDGSCATLKCSGKSCARTGVSNKISRQYIESLGFKWIPKMAIGQGCKTHLRADELPKGVLIVSVSRHLVAVIDGVIHDTFDCSRNGMRCVYGYFQL